MGQGSRRAGTTTGPSRQAQDEAQIQVLEAVLIAVIMLGAIGFVLTFTLPTSETEPTRAGLETRATDALAVLSEFPVDDTRYGGNMLSYAVAKALEGDASVLEERLKALLPPATKFNVYLSNGQEAYEVYASGTPQGETVTATYVFEPKWQYSFVGKDTKHVASPNTLGVYALPVFNSNPIDDGGVLLEVAVDFEQNGHQWTKRMYYSTVQGAVDASGAKVSSSIFGSTSTGKPLTYYDRTDAAGAYDPANRLVYVTVREDERDGEIPANAKVVLRIPQGIEAAVAPVPGTYTVEGANRTDPSVGGVLTLVLARAVTVNTPITIAIDAFNHGDRPYQYYVIDATLSGNVHGKSEILLQDRVASSFTGGDYIDVYATVPKPMGFTRASNWSVVIADAPMQPDTVAPLTVRKVAVTAVDGTALFQSVSTSAAPRGAFSVVDAGATLVWEPSPVYEFSGTKAGKALELGFLPVPLGVKTRDESHDYLTAPVTVNDGANEYVQHLTRRVEPGLFYGQIPPQGAGAPSRGAPVVLGYEEAAGTYYPIVTKPVHRGQALAGNWTYNVSAVPFKDFLSTATIDVDPREAPTGGRATIEINVENLLTRLMLRGFSVTTTTKIFPPWSITTHKPLITEVSEETTAANKDVTAVVLRDLTGDQVLDLVVGTNEGKLVGFDLGNGGAVISGLTKTWGGQAVRAVAPMEVDGKTYFVVGLARDVSTGAMSLNTLLTLDSGFKHRANAYSFDLGAHDITSLSAGLDLDGDGDPDYLVGDAQGTTAAMDGSRLDTAGETQAPISAAWPHEATARSALTAFGLTGPAAEPSAIVTNGLSTAVGVWRAADYPQSTNAGNAVSEALDLVKRVSISASTDGLLGYTAKGDRIWSFPGGGFTDLDAQDLDLDGTTDMVAGTWDGYVYAVNGTQAALPWLGMTIVSGDQITDQDFVDADSGWNVDPHGHAMRTRDGWTTRDYSNGVPAATPGAHGVDLVDRDVGYLVGAGATIWKTLDGGATVDPQTSWTIKDPTNPFLALYPGSGWGTSNFLDVEFSGRQRGIIVGTACTGTYCLGASKPIYTADGGATWAPGTIEASGPISLERVAFADALTAYAVGTQGKVYRSVDAGAAWLAVPPTANALDSWHGIDCLDSLKCWVVGDGGKMYYTANGGTSWTANATGVTADLWDVDFRDAKHGIAVGEQTTVLITRDGGLNWMLSPGGGPLIADWRSVSYTAADIAYFSGGNSTTRAMGTTSAYESSAYATTRRIVDANAQAWHSNTVIDAVQVQPIAFNNEYTYIDYYVSTTDGATYTKIVPKDPEDLDLLGAREYPMQAIAGGGSKVKLQFKMGVDLEFLFNTPVLRWVNVTYNANFTCTAPIIGTCASMPGVRGCNATTNICKETQTVLVDIQGGTDIDLGATTAELAAIGTDGARELRLPRVGKFWTAFVKGNVNDLDASRDVTGDGRKDVVVAVGAVNSALGTPTATRVDTLYLLDGVSGRTLGSYKPTPYGTTAEPWRVRFADVGQAGVGGARARDGVAEIVLAVSDTTATLKDGQMVVLDKFLGVIERWDIIGRPDVLVVADTDKRDALVLDDFIVGTAMNAQGSPGSVTVYASIDTLPAGDWTAKAAVSPEIGGRYVVNWDVDRNAAYGPYVVETEIAWTNTKTGEDQALYLANYFTVTPPRSRLPVSPVYTVHLVTWFEDWDVARS